MEREFLLPTAAAKAGPDELPEVRVAGPVLAERQARAREALTAELVSLAVAAEEAWILLEPLMAAVEAEPQPLNEVVLT